MSQLFLASVLFIICPAVVRHVIRTGRDGVDTCHGNNDTGDIDSDHLCGDLDDDDYG